jgi:hypothetical protein
VTSQTLLRAFCAAPNVERSENFADLRAYKPATDRHDVNGTPNVGACVAVATPPVDIPASLLADHT